MKKRIEKWEVKKAVGSIQETMKVSRADSIRFIIKNIMEDAQILSLAGSTEPDDETFTFYARYIINGQTESITINRI